MVKHKLFYDSDKEETWLNQQVKNGFALIKYSKLWRYEFQKCDPDEYIYRIELLEGYADSLKSRPYIELVEASGAEVVYTYMRYVCFRRKANLGEFILFSDIASKIKYYKRRVSFWIFFSILELFPTINTVISTYIAFKQDSHSLLLYSTLSILMIVIVIALIRQLLRNQKKVKKLEKEQSIHE